MLEIILIRHGETAWNTADIFRGRVNIGLSEQGLKQAEKLGIYLGRKKIKAVYCSPLQRALETAEAVAGRQELIAQPVSGLNDLDFGVWEGVPVQEVKQKYRKIFDLWKERPDIAVIPEGESLQDALKRSLDTLEAIVEENKEGTVAIVTHRVITKILICALLGLDNSHFWNIEQDTCGVTTFLYTGRRYILVRHNDTSFLEN